MYRHYALFVLMLLFNQDIASTHILTTTRDLPLPACMKLLSFAVRELCTIGEVSEETYDPPLESREMEYYRRTDMRMEVIKHCCLKPCSLPELLSIC